MSVVHTLACDHEIVSPPATLYGTRYRYACPAMSRPATTHVVLATVAGRDGWHVNGTHHLCPTHASEASA